MSSPAQTTAPLLGVIGKEFEKFGEVYECTLPHVKCKCCKCDEFADYIIKCHKPVYYNGVPLTGDKTMSSLCKKCLSEHLF